MIGNNYSSEDTFNEFYNKEKINLGFESSQVNKGKTIVVSSGKGGVGKTTTSLNLAYNLAKLKKDVILLDANLTTPNVGLHLGLTKFPVTLNDYLLGDGNLEDCIYVHPLGFKIIPGSLSIKALAHFDTFKIKSLFAELKKMCDYLIVDSAAGLGNEATMVLRNADEILIVTHPEIPAITDAFKVVSFAKDIGIPIRGVILNRLKEREVEIGFRAIENLLEAPITVAIGEDKNMRKALYSKKPISHTHPKTHSSKQYEFLANRVIQGYYQRKIGELEEENSRLKRVLRKFL